MPRRDARRRPRAANERHRAISKEDSRGKIVQSAPIEVIAGDTIAFSGRCLPPGWIRTRERGDDGTFDSGNQRILISAANQYRILRRLRCCNSTSHADVDSKSTHPVNGVQLFAFSQCTPPAIRRARIELSDCWEAAVLWHPEQRAWLLRYRRVGTGASLSIST